MDTPKGQRDLADITMLEFGLLWFDGSRRGRRQSHWFRRLSHQVGELDHHRRPRIEVTGDLHRRQAPEHGGGFDQLGLDGLRGPLRALAGSQATC